MEISDVTTNANVDEILITHILLDWTINFEKQNIFGTATYNLNVLDGSSLKIEQIICNDKVCEFFVENVGLYGDKIIIKTQMLTPPEICKLEITYEVSQNASALQFVSPELTGDKQKPFLFSQCQSVHCRSIVPCQDTPRVKQTYMAKVKVPDGIICLMSGLKRGEDLLLNNGLREFTYEQPIPIPSYLIAIVAGLLEKRDISKRCCVWAEPSIVDKAFWEFEETEKMLQAAEEIAGDYVWTRYDLVVMPPFFPFGGMENPCLTFVTPSLIAGDRSLTYIIAHEIAHSWTGNLVTNATWEHFWLNEGFTTYLERVIVGKLYGEQQRQFDCLCGWENCLLPSINEKYNITHELTKLIPNISNMEPDEYMTSIPYEKGSALLLYVEQQLGDPNQMSQFLQSYLKKFSKQSIITKDWLDFFFVYFKDKKCILDQIDFDKWLNSPGIPPNKPEYDQSLYKKCVNLANVWCNSPNDDIKKVDAEEFKQMSTNEKVAVLNIIEKSTNIKIEIVELLQEKYSLNESGNGEILTSWINIALKAKWKPIIELALKFVTNNGRMKYVNPIYKKLFEWPESKELAIKTFEKNIPTMHAITTNAIKLILKNVNK